MSGAPVPKPGAPRVTPEARRVAAVLRPGFDLRAGFIGLTGAVHLEWRDGVSKLVRPEDAARVLRTGRPY